MRLREEVLDLEDFSESVALNEFTLDDFRIELSKYIEANRKLLEDAPLGLYAVVPPHPEQQIIAPGVVFCLKQKGEAKSGDTVNGQCDLSLTLSRAAVSANEGAVFETNTDERAKQILRKMETCSIEIANITKINRGVHPYRTDGYGKSRFSKGCQTQRDYDERSYHANRKLNNSYYPEVRGKHIHPYALEESQEFISWGDWLAEPREFFLFEGERIYLRKIVGKTLFACYVKDTIVADQSVYIAVPSNQEYKAKYILGILNSTLLAWYFRNKHNEFDTLFPQIKVTEFKKLPIAKSSCQQTVVELVDKIIAAKRRNDNADTSALEKEIDLQVYNLYSLTTEEITIVEGSITQ